VSDDELDRFDGGVPAAARERLGKIRTGETTSFSSALGVAEALAVREAGFEPVCQVMGTCYYKLGWQNVPWGGSSWGGRDGMAVELDTQSAAWNEARTRAVDRLREEAALAGADAVVGVHLRRAKRDWMTDLVEFVAVGTAVRSRRYDLGADGPLLANLSGQDVAKLVREGVWPVGIVGGSTIVYVQESNRQAWRSRGWGTGRRNQELADYTEGMYAAREFAMRHVSEQAHALHARGVVGVTIDRSQSEREREVNNTKYIDLIIELHVMGTAVVEVAHDAPPTRPAFVLPLT
jgi:uncharacterized protein YbjQ (UPF0145 family)